MTYIHNIDPVLISLGPLQIHYYGLAYVVGLLLCFFIAKQLIKKKEYPLTNEELEDYMLYIVIGLLIGARLFYFLFYNTTNLLNNPLQLIKIWEGGMSFHGGLIGILCAGYIFCKKYKKDFYTMADLTVIPAALALGIGRIANFINGELYGRITTLPWNVDFGDGLTRHPSQLYEAAKNWLIFAILWNVKNKEYRKGTIFWLFITLYGLFRFMIEFVREPDPQLGFVILNFFTMGQILTGIMAIIGACALISIYLKTKH
jgi:phosphatidylglycerol---prolipoprotein diacylglyceryl transferase